MAIKKSLGVSVFGILSTVFGAIILTLSIIPLLLSPLSIEIQEMICSQAINFLYRIILGSVSLLCGIGLLKLKRWGKTLFITLAIFSLGYGVYGFCYKILYPVKFNNAWLIINSFSILFWCFVIWFFNRKSIKEQFTT